MHDPRCTPPEEAALDHLLQASLPELPPAEIAQGVTPWRRAMDRILWGLALTSITLQFWNLQYLLPTIGLVLLMLGFRALRRENGWLAGCFVLAAFRLACTCFLLVINAALYREVFYALPWNSLSVRLFFYAVQLLQLFCFWQGLRGLQRRAGQPIRTGGAAALLFWYALLFPLFLLQYQGWFGIIALLVLYYLILRSIYGLSFNMEKAGYCVRPASVKLSDRMLCLLLCVLLAAGFAGAHLFSSRYAMDWAPAPSAASADQAVCARLAALGFPQRVLADLTPEDLAACADAEQVWVHTSDCSAETNQLAVPVPPEHLQITTVAVRLPGAEEPLYKIFHHFFWAGDLPFYGTESLQLQAAQLLDEDRLQENDVTGQVLYDSSGTTYCAPYHAIIAVDTLEEYDPFFGVSEIHSSKIRAAFSYPARSENQRGYLTYTMDASQCNENSILRDWLQYIHQNGWMQYPVRSALSYQAFPYGSDGPFSCFEDTIQLFTNTAASDTAP